MAFFVIFSPAIGRCALIDMSTSTLCTTNQGSVAGTSACSLAGLPNGASKAQSSAAYSISGNSMNITSSVSASATETFGPTSLTGASADSAASMTFDLSTPGTLRSGFVLVSGPLGGAGAGVDPDSDASVGFSLGSNASGGAAAWMSCTNLTHGGSNNHCDYFPGLIPIMLGTALDFSGTLNADANSAVILGTANAFAGLTVTFQFFEADGVTPVDVLVPTPEPGTWTLFAAGLLTIAFTLRKKAAKRFETKL